MWNLSSSVHLLLHGCTNTVQKNEALSLLGVTVRNESLNELRDAGPCVDPRNHGPPAREADRATGVLKGLADEQIERLHHGFFCVIC